MYVSDVSNLVSGAIYENEQSMKSYYWASTNMTAIGQRIVSCRKTTVNACYKEALHL